MCRLDCADHARCPAPLRNCEFLSTYVSIDALSGKSPPEPESESPQSSLNKQNSPSARPTTEPGAEPLADLELRESEVVDDEWSGAFARTLQTQHARIREFLESRSDLWRQVVARCELQIERLQSEIAELSTANDDLREQAASAVHSEPREERNDNPDVSKALGEIRDLKARNSELERQLRETSSAPRRSGQAAPPSDTATDWESQKRRLLAELESDEANGPKDADSKQRRLQIEEVIARTDRVIAEKDREIQELKHLLSSQTGSLGGLAMGAAALDEVFNQDDIIREERGRLQQAQEELQQKLRKAEIDLATERARLARREAEIEERLRAEPKPPEGDGEALAPTGRPVRGRWRTQLGLGDDKSTEGDRRR
jgi:chromosome segregation protein